MRPVKFPGTERSVTAQADALEAANKLEVFGASRNSSEGHVEEEAINL